MLRKVLPCTRIVCLAAKGWKQVRDEMRAHAQSRGGVAQAQSGDECGEARGRCQWWKQGNVFCPLLIVVVVVIVCPSVVSLCTLVANGAVSGISAVVESIRGSDRVQAFCTSILRSRV